MKYKPIILQGDKQKAFIKVIAAQFGVSSAAEIILIEKMVEMDMFTPFHVDKYTRQKLQKECNLQYNTLGTCLRRLTKAGIIARMNKNLYLIPAFRGLDKVDAIMFKV